MSIPPEARQGKPPRLDTSPGGSAESKKPFRDDLCLAIMSLPGYSLTDGAILLDVAKHSRFGETTCTALPETIARDLGGKVKVRTVQLRLLAFEADGLTTRLKSSRGPHAVRETVLTEKFWALVRVELAKINPARYGCTQGDHPKRNPVRLDAGFQAQPAVLQAQNPPSQAQSGAPQAQSGAFAYKEETATETATKSSSNSRAGDDDDVRSAPRGEESRIPDQPPPPGEHPTVDDQRGIERACEVIRRLGNLPPSLARQLRDRPDVGARIGHDWSGLMMATCVLSDKIRLKEVRPKSIENPLNYLLTVFANVPVEVPPGQQDGIRLKLDRLLDTAAPGSPRAPLTGVDPEVLARLKAERAERDRKSAAATLRSLEADAAPSARPRAEVLTRDEQVARVQAWTAARRAAEERGELDRHRAGGDGT